MNGQMTVQQAIGQVQQMMAAGQAAQALPLAQAVADQHPGIPQLQHMLGTVLMAVGRRSDAVGRFEAAAEAVPDEIRVLFDLAQAYRGERRFDDARARLDHVLELIDDGKGDAGMKVRTLTFKADLDFMQGEYDRAYALLKPVAEGHPGALLTLAQVCAASGRHDEAESALRSCMQAPRLTPAARADALFRLARLLEDRGRHGEAFDAAEQANTLKGSLFDPRVHRGLTDEMLKVWTPEAIEQMPHAVGTKSDRPVFIVGMPRSGTSLVEQILASHPDVFGAGELPHVTRYARLMQGAFAADPPLVTSLAQMNIDSLTGVASAYLDNLESIAPDAARVTDKMPLNVLHLGLISRMLPGAKVIHCTRDPVDTCVSCYFQNFAGSMPFAYDLSHLGQFYRDYKRLMAHWRSVLDLPVLDVAYEEMVADQEGQSRRLVEFLGLDWDDNCLRFHESERVTMTVSAEQVRRPIYSTSVNRRDHHTDRLGPLIEALGDLA